MLTKRHALVAGGAAVLLAAGTATIITVTSQGSSGGARTAHLASSTCTGPAGAAYVALAGYQSFDAIDTSNCSYIQNYNVGDPQVLGDSGTTTTPRARKASLSTATRCTSPTPATTWCRSSTRPR